MSAPSPARTVEVFAEVGCPFTHVGLRRFVARREERGRADVRLRVRSWPLELVNDAPLDAALVAEEVEELRAQVAPDLFAGFDPARFPTTSRPAMALAAAAYRAGDDVGERVSLALREAVFEQGHDVTDPAVLRAIAARYGVAAPTPDDHHQAVHDWREGQARGVVGSPYFFVDDQGWFCPSLDIRRDGDQLRIRSDPAALEAFLARCLDEP